MGCVFSGQHDVGRNFCIKWWIDNWIMTCNGCWLNVIIIPHKEEIIMGKGEDNRGRNTTKGFAWRKAVFKRDGYKCQHCGTDKKLCAHHIVEWFNDESLRYVVSNG